MQSLQMQALVRLVQMQLVQHLRQQAFPKMDYCYSGSMQRTGVRWIWVCACTGTGTTTFEPVPSGDVDDILLDGDT